jgi:uncharacterized peroxidase-related enzyme
MRVPTAVSPRDRGYKMGLFSKLFGGGETQPNAVEAPATPAPADTRDRAWESVSGVVRMTCPIPGVEEDQATGETAEIYDAIKKSMQVPTVPNINKVLAHSPQALKGTVGILGELYMSSSFPQPVVSMLLYSISLARRCQYCSSMHRLTSRMVGVDEAMLSAVGNNLGSVTPERVQAIVAFGVKSAMSSNDVAEEDFENLRDMGISDAEIVEIVALSGLGVYLNIVADALKIDVDEMIKQGLAE